LFGEDFGQKVKQKFELAAALRKIVYQQTLKRKRVFQRGYPTIKNNEASSIQGTYMYMHSTSTLRVIGVSFGF